MPRIQILNKEERRELEKSLKENFGIEKIQGTILKKGEERLFLFQGNLDEKTLKKLDKIRINIERVGIYFAKVIENRKRAYKEFRLSIEGTQLFKDQITKNIFELDDKQAEEWMYGRELLIETGRQALLVMKYKDNLLGCGKASKDKISNFIPKNRRLKVKGN